MTDEQIKRATRAVCAARLSGGYCECIGHEAHGCMVGYGQAPDWRHCKMTDEAVYLTGEYLMAQAALASVDMLPKGQDHEDGLGAKQA